MIVFSANFLALVFVFCNFIQPNVIKKCQIRKKKSEKELDELNEKIALTNQQLYDIQKLASDKDAEIQTLKVKVASVLLKNEGLKRGLKQEQKKNQNCDIKGDS